MIWSVFAGSWLKIQLEPCSSWHILFTPHYQGVRDLQMMCIPFVKCLLSHTLGISLFYLFNHGVKVVDVCIQWWRLYLGGLWFCLFNKHHVKLSYTDYRTRWQSYYYYIYYFNFHFYQYVYMWNCYAMCCISVIVMAAMATMNQASWQHPETGRERERAKRDRDQDQMEWETERERERACVLHTRSHVHTACTSLKSRFIYPTVFSPGKSWQWWVLFLSHWAEEQSEDRLIS